MSDLRMKVMDYEIVNVTIKKSGMENASIKCDSNKLLKVIWDVLQRYRKAHQPLCGGVFQTSIDVLINEIIDQFIILNKPLELTKGSEFKEAIRKSLLSFLKANHGDKKRKLMPVPDYFTYNPYSNKKVHWTKDTETE